MRNLRPKCRACAQALLCYNGTIFAVCAARSARRGPLMSADVLRHRRSLYRAEAGHSPDLGAFAAPVVQEQAASADKQQRARPAEWAGGDVRVEFHAHVQLQLKSAAT